MQQQRVQQQLTATRQLWFAVRCRAAMAPKCMQRKLLNARLICIRQRVVHCAFLASVCTWGGQSGRREVGQTGCSVLVAQFRICRQRNCFICPLKCTRERERARRKFKHFIAFFVTPLHSTRHMHHPAPQTHLASHASHAPSPTPMTAAVCRVCISVFHVHNR